MIRPGRDSSRYDSLRASRRTLARIAPLVQLGLLSVGFTMFLDETRALVSDAQFTWGERRIMGFAGLSYLASFGLGAWVVGKVLVASTGLIDVFIDQAESSARAVELIELHAIPAIGRLSLALENLAATNPATAPAPSPRDDKARAAELARKAIGEGRWAAADRLVSAFVHDHPGPDAARLMAELDDARSRAVAALRARVEAARKIGDGPAAIDARDALTELIRGSELDDLDRGLVRWLVGLIQSRVRAGTIRADLAQLASRVAETFGDTPEGARLVASIPNLRRSAGLCPACGRPHRGEPRLLPALPIVTRPRPPFVGRARGEPMSIRLRCRSCQAAFVTSDDMVGQSVPCPKCDATQVVRAPKVDESADPPLARMKAPAAPSPDAGGSIFLPKDRKPKKKGEEAGKSKAVVRAGLLLIPILIVAGLVAYPTGASAPRRWSRGRPTTICRPW